MSRCSRCQARRETVSGPCPSCLLPVEDAPLLALRYRLDEEIGEGGMGVVFKAFDLKLRRTVAAKVAKGPLDGEVKERFLREAQTLAALRHPSIVAALDVGEEEGELFIIMDFVDGIPLSRWNAPSLTAIEQIARDMCAALEHAHRRGVIHRDVKPENVLVGTDGRARLTDFGIARLREDTHRLTRDGRVAGTPRYMAPEALRGETPAPSHDLYSLGLVLKELVERTPNSGEASLLGPVIAAATSSEASQRFTEAQEMSAALTAGFAPLPSDSPKGSITDLWSARLWLRPLAVLMSLGTASLLWAFLLSVTPRVITRAEVGPLVMTQFQDRGDGTVVSPARFETGAWLMALLFMTIAFALFGAWLVLLKHLPKPTPSGPPRESQWLFFMGLANVSLWVFHVLIIGRERPGLFLRYLPILGGLLELVLLVLLWTAVLECLVRRQNPLQNKYLWAGSVLMVIPPGIELIHYVRTWHP